MLLTPLETLFLVYRWGLEHLQELVGSKLKSYEREIKELHMLLFPEVCFVLLV
mgnify:CR=1 FL=1